MRTTPALLAALALAAPTLAQDFAILPAFPDESGPAYSVPGPRPTAGHAASLDHAALIAALDAAPVHTPDMDLLTRGLAILLPGPYGSLIPCRAALSPVMEPELAAQFPDIRTYIVQAEDKTAVGRFEVSPRGLTAMLRTITGDTWLIDPWRSGDNSVVVAYLLRDLPGGGDWVCHTPNPPSAPNTPIHRAASSIFSPRAFQPTRTNRVAMACTGEYGLHHSTIQGHAPNSADPLAAIVTVIARTNVVYEQDLGVHFNLVANNNLLIHTNADTDPFPSSCDGGGGADCSGSILGVLPDYLRSTIGRTYDVGHCITRIAGGVANLPAGCRGGAGVSGIPRGGDVDPFSALVVIHEIGHQFGAYHTFSGVRGRCGNNATLQTAWEAGSGSSPMAYAGGCPVGDAPPTDNITQFADPFFHHGSIEQMQAYLSSNDATCMTAVPSTNNIPTFTFVTPSTAIPPRTPFTLTAAATDADNDPLTYSWEQFDNGVRRPLSGEGSLDNGAGSLFRIFTPTTNPTRTFPAMSNVLAGQLFPLGEQLPSVTGVTRRFRAIVRDNRPGMGGTAISSFVDLAIPANAGTFAIETPAENAVLRPGSSTITWLVGNTNLAPISAASVTIRLSTDDGATFPIALGTFPNTGSANVTLPVSLTPARIRLDPVDKIFFSISRPFTVVPCPGDFNLDGFVDFFDYDSFVTAFESGDLAADRNGDGFIDFFDYDQFVGDFESAC